MNHLLPVAVVMLTLAIPGHAQAWRKATSKDEKAAVAAALAQAGKDKPQVTWAPNDLADNAAGGYLVALKGRYSDGMTSDTQYDVIKNGAGWKVTFHPDPPSEPDC